MAFLKLLDNMDDTEGYFEGNTIGVNVEFLWKVNNTRAELKFIKDFVDTYSHELLHMIIYKHHPDRKHRNDLMFGEEKIIYSMTGHKWTKELDKWYKKYYGVKINGSAKK